jgi:hypothetical protein
MLLKKHWGSLQASGNRFREGRIYRKVILRNQWRTKSKQMTLRDGGYPTPQEAVIWINDENND